MDIANIDWAQLPPETIVPRKVARALTSISERQQTRLEREGKFPKSVEISTGRCRYVLAEVLRFSKDRGAERGSKAGGGQPMTINYADHAAPPARRGSQTMVHLYAPNAVRTTCTNV
jgi:hypothetical protein